MLNSTTLNESEIGAPVAPEALTQDAIVFNGYSLQNSDTILTETIDYDDLGKMDFNTFDFARNNGGGVNSKYYRGRTVTLRGVIKKSTAVLLNSLIDEVKKNTATTEGYLDITVNDEIRRCKATCTKINFNRQHYNVTFCPFVIVFTILEPFFYRITDESASYVGKTGTFSEEFTNVGTATTEPILYFIFGTSTVTAITINNPDTTTLAITEAITTGDVLIVNAKEKTVTLNGTEIDYSGVFPLFEVGSNPFSVTIT